MTNRLHQTINKLHQTNMKEYRLQVVLNYVRKYIDKRAYVSKGGVIKYSIAIKPDFKTKVHFEKRVLTPNKINTIFYEVNK